MTNNHCSWLFSIVAVILAWPSVGQEPPTPQQLIDAAHRASDLSKLGPYTLTANVTIDSGDKETPTTGRLTIARDRGRVREELELGGVREVKIHVGDKEYIVPPPVGLSAMALMDFDRRWDPVHFMASRFNAVRRVIVDGVDAWCMSMQSVQPEVLSCFDPAKGVYLGDVRDEKMSSEYFDFTSVGNQLFYPRRAVILRDDVGRIEVSSIEIAPGALKEDLFTPPDNAIEIETCRGQSFPKPLYTPEPHYPEREEKQKAQGVARLSLIVDKEGNVAMAEVLTSPSEGFAREAVAAAKRWRFAPATCAGHHVNRETNVEISFHLY